MKVTIVFAVGLVSGLLLAARLSEPETVQRCAEEAPALIDAPRGLAEPEGFTPRSGDNLARIAARINTIGTIEIPRRIPTEEVSGAPWASPQTISAWVDAHRASLAQCLGLRRFIAGAGRVRIRTVREFGPPSSEEVFAARFDRVSYARLIGDYAYDAKVVAEIAELEVALGVTDWFCMPKVLASPVFRVRDEAVIELEFDVAD